jgi:ribosomal protein L6P/L9E
MSSKDKFGIELEIPKNVVVKKEDQMISVTGKNGTISTLLKTETGILSLYVSGKTIIESEIVSAYQKLFH